MSAAAVEKKRWTVEEYPSNLIAALVHSLGEQCRVYGSAMRVHVHATGLFTYADALVVCDKPQFTADKPPSLLNPLVIFEVLSESTESYDRGKKFENYRTIPSLMHYGLVAQDRALVEHYARQPDGSWVLREVRMGQKLRLPCGDVPADPFYRHVL